MPWWSARGRLAFVSPWEHSGVTCWRLVLRQGAILATTGIALGLAGAAAATRVLQSMLFGVAPLDPTTFAAVSLMFGAVATLASYMPARRATKVDPMVALRND